MVVITDIVADYSDCIIKTGRGIGTNTLPFQALMPTFNFPVALRIIGGSFNVRHSADTDEFFEIPGNKLGGVIRNNSRTEIRKFLPGPHQAS